MPQLTKKERRVTIVVLSGFIIYLIILFNSIPNLLDPSTHLFAHSLMELASISITAVIIWYGWLTWSYTRSRVLLLISIFFLSVVIFDVLHTLTFMGMPFSINEQIPTWFWLMARLAEIFTIFSAFLLARSGNTNSRLRSEKYILFTSSLLYTFLITFILFKYSNQFPLLINQGEGTTAIKNNIEYSFAIFHLIMMFFLAKKYFHRKDEFYLSLLVSFYFFILCSLTMTLYQNVHDVVQLIGHLYKIIGYYFILRAFYVKMIKVQFEEKKITEEQLLDTKVELKNILLQNQGIIIILVKKGNEFVHTLCDGKLLNDLGLTSEQVVGHTVHDFLRKEVADQLHSDIERIWLEGDGRIEFEIYDGVFLMMTLTRVATKGKSAVLIGNIVDITELKRAEALLRKTEKLTIVGELAAGFAHEIRNPLTTIKGFLQLMSQEKNAPTEKYIDIMLEEIDRLEMITSEFMVVAKPEATKYQSLEFTKVIDDVIQFLAPQSLLKSVQIFYHTDIDHVHVYGDEHHLKQVFINVFKNAIDAMPKGGNIYTKLTVEDSFVRVAITDEGCGIPEELLPRLGEPFYSLKEKGTGLGLMVTYKIIEAHNGELEITSMLDIGTTVIIKLPIVFSENLIAESINKQEALTGKLKTKALSDKAPLTVNNKIETMGE